MNADANIQPAMIPRTQEAQSNGGITDRINDIPMIEIPLMTSSGSTTPGGLKEIPPIRVSMPARNTTTGITSLVILQNVRFGARKNPAPKIKIRPPRMR